MLAKAPVTLGPEVEPLKPIALFDSRVSSECNARETSSSGSGSAFRSRPGPSGGRGGAGGRIIVTRLIGNWLFWFPFPIGGAADTTAFAIDANGTLHVLYTDIPGLGTRQVYHVYKAAGQAWSSPVRVSHSIQGAEVPTVAGYEFLFEESSGRMHLLFETIPNFGVRQVWSTELDISNLSGGWSTPVNVSQASQPAAAEVVVVDSNGTVHLIFSAVQGTTQLYHAYRALGQSWTSPVLLSNTGQGANLPIVPGYRFLQEVSGHLQLFFEAIPGLGTTQLFNMELDIGNLPGGWSSPQNISLASQGVAAEAIVVDASDTVHVVFGAVPGFGTTQLHHLYKELGQPWSTPVNVSNMGQGAQMPPSNNYEFFVESPANRLNLIFQSIPGVGVRQMWHTTLDASSLPASWTAPTNVSQSLQPAAGEALLVDGNGTLHLLFSAVFGSVTQLHHVHKQPTQPWSTPSVISTGISAGIFPDPFGYEFLLEDGSGDLQLLFAQIPGIGVRQLFNTELDLANLAAGWSPPVAVSQSIQPVTPDAVVLDSNGVLHAIFGAVPGTGTNQLHHSYKSPGQAWSSPAIVSHTPQGAGLPIEPGYEFLQEDDSGTLQLFYEAIPGLGVSQLWNRGFDIYALSIWSVPAQLSE